MGHCRMQNIEEKKTCGFIDPEVKGNFSYHFRFHPDNKSNFHLYFDKKIGVRS